MADTGSVSNKRMSCSIPERFQLHAAMLALQFGYAGFHVVSRAALNMGISKLVFPVYRNVIALILLLPFAYFMEKKDRPALTLNFVLQFFLLALVGITANQGFYLLGLDNTSPTFASAIQNSVPAITFLMAVLLRIEQVRLKRKDGIAKVVGTLCCVAGATVITLYKGPAVYSPATTITVQSTAGKLMGPGMFPSLGDAKGKSWTLGCVYLFGHCLSWSAWLVLQAPVLKKYPARLSVTSFTCFFGLVQFFIIATAFERDAQAWLFHSDAEAFSIVYAGVVASGIAFAVQIWCIDRGGPVFVAVYQPVQTFVVALMASFALGEEFYLGGIIGAVLIISGLYLVLWGKSEEKKLLLEWAVIQSTPDHVTSRTSGHIKPSLNQPLLHPTAENV
ncbi:protein WALLS ARE THIN 1-like isoform X2 [Cucurbita pepo subsp. pepo]|uniref:protein WALLS ARE THIN 1-like isoform X1 n=1 Tax=Cucurbita pepo subsp. pepo TaxID=3664 RepID=UPI000C9D5544|nr:protein WALLS ARE THIN 1-like isoform X1 [Cucurbita pepo subsp. pepo]XP_023537134.1 protein WALLS ARE THIN 1-like isoform X2 [Cucurbita pepo subsp. pepo]